jgi:hypothetical protein
MNAVLDIPGLQTALLPATVRFLLAASVPIDRTNDKKYQKAKDRFPNHPVEIWKKMYVDVLNKYTIYNY